MEFALEGVENIVGKKEKMLITSIFSFSHKKSTKFFSLVYLNPLPNNKTLNLSNLKGFTDNSLNMYQNFKFDLGRVENIVGKGENAGNWEKKKTLVTSIFSFSHNVFKGLLP